MFLPVLSTFTCTACERSFASLCMCCFGDNKALPDLKPSCRALAGSNTKGQHKRKFQSLQAWGTQSFLPPAKRTRPTACQRQPAPEAVSTYACCKMPFRVVLPTLSVTLPLGFNFKCACTRCHVRLSWQACVMGVVVSGVLAPGFPICTQHAACTPYRK